MKRFKDGCSVKGLSCSYVTIGATRVWFEIFLANSLFGSAEAMRDARLVRAHDAPGRTLVGRRLKYRDISKQSKRLTYDHLTSTFALELERWYWTSA